MEEDHFNDVRFASMSGTTSRCWPTGTGLVNDLYALQMVTHQGADFIAIVMRHGED